MSGIEIAGLIAGVASLLTTAQEAYNSIKDIAGLPLAFTEVAKRVPLVVQTLRAVEAKAVDAPQSTVKALTPVVQSCKENAETLKVILEKLEPGESAWSLDRYLAIIKSRGKKGRVEDLMKKILQDVQLLASDQTMRTATAAQMEGLTAALEELKNVEPSAPDELFEDGGGINISHGGTGAQLNQIGNNNTSHSGSGHNFGDLRGAYLTFSAPGTERPREAKIQEVLRRLYTSHYRDRKDRNPARIPGTCEWFTTHQLFQYWRDSQGSRLLWVSADPGCGKSVLAKHLVDTVLPKSKSRTTCYFFFKDDSEDQKSLTSALCCILRQLFIAKPELLSDSMLQTFERDGERLTSSFFDLWGMLLTASRSQGAGEIMCIFDALDECETEGRAAIIEVLPRLLQGGGSDTSLKVLLTSRPYAHIQQGFKLLEAQIPTIHLRGENEIEIHKISREIDLVIKTRVSNIAVKLDLEAGEEKLLHGELTRIPNRTYLWVYLVCDMLENAVGVSQGTIRDIIREVPKTVEEAYENILRRSGDSEKAKLLLHIIVGAQRPLSLKELVVAFELATHRSLEGFHAPAGNKFQDTIRNLCGLFVHVVDSKVYLIHQTAKDFLIQQQPKDLPAAWNTTSHAKLRWKSSLSTTESNRILRNICVRYLHYVGEKYPFNVQELRIVTEKYPSVISQLGLDYLKYAATYWGVHSNHACIEDDLEMEDLILKVSDTKWDGCQAWMRLYFNMVPFEEKHMCPVGHDTSLISFTPLILASYFGVLHLVTIHMKKKHPRLNARDNLGRSALWWASRLGHVEVVKRLLEKTANSLLTKLLPNAGVDVNSKDDENKQTPLLIAAKYGNEEIVQLLLATGKANPDAMDLAGDNALLYTARHGDTAMVKLLLDTEKVNVNATYKTTIFRKTDGVTPLFWAVKEGHTQVVKLLLETGKADITSKDIIHAQAGEHWEILNLLREYRK